jgi:hypothetical protein
MGNCLWDCSGGHWAVEDGWRAGRGRSVAFVGYFELDVEERVFEGGGWSLEGGGRAVDGLVFGDVRIGSPGSQRHTPEEERYTYIEYKECTQNFKIGWSFCRRMVKQQSCTYRSYSLDNAQDRCVQIGTTKGNYK